MSAWVAGLVMTNSGTGRPTRFERAATFSACQRNSVAPETGPIGNTPLGLSDPSRLPCPPATTNSATFPAASASSPRRRCASVNRDCSSTGTGAKSPAGLSGSFTE